MNCIMTTKISAGGVFPSWKIRTSNSAETKVVGMGKIFSSGSLGVTARGLILNLHLI